jgi:hypothetical protein
MGDKTMLVSLFLLVGVVSFYIFKNDGENFGKRLFKEEDLYENFDNYHLDSIGSKVAKNPNKELLLSGTNFPIKSKIELSSKNAQDSWFLFPHNSKADEGGISSYDQITNNFRYQRNPDIGNTLPGELNSIFYQNNVNRKGNKVCFLDPVEESPEKVRVGFFNTEVDVLY